MDEAGGGGGKDVGEAVVGGGRERGLEKEEEIVTDQKQKPSTLLVQMKSFCFALAFLAAPTSALLNVRTHYETKVSFTTEQWSSEHGQSVC